MVDVFIERLPLQPADEDVAALASVLSDAVARGASVGFLAPLSTRHAAAWWRRSIGDADTITLVAREGTAVVGVVQVVLAVKDNALHRAEITKLVVAIDWRGNGLGRALLKAAEDAALEHGRTLLVLDTESDSPAQALYESAGWKVAGTIEDYARRPDRTLAATTIFSKTLGSHGD